MVAKKKKTMKLSKRKAKKQIKPIRQRSGLIFITLFAVIGVILLIRSFAASTTVTYSGKLTQNKPIDSYTISTATGDFIATLSSKDPKMRVTVRNSVGTSLGTASGSRTSTVKTQVTPGTYSVVVSYDGTMSNKPLNYKLTVTYPVNDATSPVAVITSPGGTTVTGTITFSASATDDTGVTKVELLIDGTIVATKTASPYSYSWDTTQTANGGHTLSVKAYDAAGNVGTASLSVTVDNTTSTPISCTGVSVSPGQFSQTLVNNYPAGTTFCIKAGTHYISGNGISPRANDKYIGEPGAVIDGQNSAVYAFLGYGGTTGPVNVTISGLVIKNIYMGASNTLPYTSNAIKSGYGWIIENNEITGMGPGTIAILMNDNGVVRNNKIHDNQWMALNGGPSSLTGSTYLIENNEIYRNYTCLCHGPDGNDGLSKFHGGGGNPLFGLTWRGNWIHDNYGHAIWSDGRVYATYESNVIENNTGAGIFHEISYDSVIANNTLRNNATDRLGASCYNGNILVGNSQNIKIYGNTVDASNGTNGICVKSTTRSDASDIQYASNIQVYDNTITLNRAPNGFAGEVGLIGGSTTPPQNISFNGNRYYVKSMSDTYFAWIQYPIDWTTFRSKGQESTGTIQLW
jgi:parallel beta-helix repeat protein